MTNIIETERLILRTWKAEDIDPYFQINQDPKVLEFFSGPLTMEQVKSFIEERNAHQEKHGYTFWAAELKETKELIGFIGLKYSEFFAHFTSVVEIGWRLGSKFWGKNYAPEGAKASLEYGFSKYGLKEIISFTVPANFRSRRVMEKIGMERDIHGDFAHPKFAKDHPLSHHVLYRIIKNQFLSS